MSNQAAPNETMSVYILDKDYQVACPEDEREALLSAASELDRRMRAIRQTGTVIGMERIAVMAALNLANEVLHSIDKKDPEDQHLLEAMCQEVDRLLSHS